MLKKLENGISISLGKLAFLLKCGYDKFDPYVPYPEQIELHIIGGKKTKFLTYEGENLFNVKKLREFANFWNNIADLLEKWNKAVKKSEEIDGRVSRVQKIQMGQAIYIFDKLKKDFQDQSVPKGDFLLEMQKTMLISKNKSEEIFRKMKDIGDIYEARIGFLEKM